MTLHRGFSKLVATCNAKVHQPPSTQPCDRAHAHVTSALMFLRKHMPSDLCLSPPDSTHSHLLSSSSRLLLRGLKCSSMGCPHSLCADSACSSRRHWLYSLGCRLSRLQGQGRPGAASGEEHDCWRKTCMILPLTSRRFHFRSMCKCIFANSLLGSRKTG